MVRGPLWINLLHLKPYFMEGTVTHGDEPSL